MTVKATRAATDFQQSTPNPHKLISLLMAGTLERVEQAKQAVEQGNDQEKFILVEKIVAIINGLRASLNFEQGGDIAITLDQLYAYMLERIFAADSKEDEQAVLEEIEKLMAEVKSGWDQADSAQAA